MTVKDLIDWRDVNYLTDKLTTYEDMYCLCVLHVYMIEERNRIKLYNNHIKLYEYVNDKGKIIDEQTVAQNMDIEYYDGYDFTKIKNMCYYVITIHGDRSAKDYIAEFYNKICGKFEKLDVSLSSMLYIKSKSDK